MRARPLCTIALPLVMAACAIDPLPDETPPGLPELPRQGAAPGSIAGGGADVPPARVGPTVVATGPLADETEVELGAELDVTFSTEMMPHTVAAHTFALRQDGAPVSGTITYELGRSHARFAPASPLVRGVRHEATLTTGVADSVGTNMAAAYTWSFTTAARGWDDRHVLPGAEGAPIAVTASDGAIVVAWSVARGESSEVWATRVLADGTWEPAVQIEASSGIAAVPALAVGAGGQVAAAWSSIDGIKHAIRFSLYRPGTGWSTPEEIAGDDGRYHHDPDVVLDAAGDATVVWLALDGAQSAWARHRTAGGRWQDAVLLEHDDGPGAAGPGVHYHDVQHLHAVLGADRVVTALWTQEDDEDASRIWSSRLVPGAGWSERAEVGEGFADGVAPVIDGDGTISALWTRVKAGVIEQVLARGRHGAWSTEVVDIGPRYHTRLLVDPTGAVTIVWVEPAQVAHRLVARRLTTAGWAAPAIVAQSEGWFAAPGVATGADGQLHVLWARSSALGLELAHRRFVPGTGWTRPGTVAREPIGGAILTAPLLAVQPAGSALALWQRQELGVPAPRLEVVLYR